MAKHRMRTRLEEAVDAVFIFDIGSHGTYPVVTKKQREYKRERFEEVHSLFEVHGADGELMIWNDVRKVRESIMKGMGLEFAEASRLICTMLHDGWLAKTPSPMHVRFVFAQPIKL